MNEDATRLIAALCAKLQLLDDQVAALRHELSDEFTKFSEDLLQDVPDEVTDSVVHAISASAVDYPALFPNPAESPPVIARHDLNSANGRKSPPPVLHHTSGIPTCPRATHDTAERGTDFEGVFTPLYLPLLGNDPPQSPPPVSPRPSNPRINSNMSEGTQTLEIGDNFRQPPPLARRNTDSSSVDSREGETRIRSALRRSSSASNRVSPRRVRFDVQGEEVLPTSSPQPSTTALTQLGSIDTPPQLSARDSAETSTADDSNDFRPYMPPRKLSSSERLRALSKMPLEDPSNWTVVNPQGDSDETSRTSQETETETTSMAVRIPSPDSETDKGKRHEPAAPIGIPSPSALFPGEPLATYEDANEDDSPDDGLSMRPRKKGAALPTSKSSTPAASTQQQLKTLPVKSRALTPIKEATESSVKGEGNSGDRELLPKVNGHEVHDLACAESKSADGAVNSDDVDEEEEDIQDDDQLFEFEDENQRAPKARPSKPTTKSKPQAYQRREVAGPDQTGKSSGLQLELGSQPVVKNPSPPLSPSVGSYRGRPITLFEVVKDPAVHDKARTMGGVSSFVGSVDGRNALDGDMQSYRASMGQAEFSGTPRSLTERMMMEEANKERRSKDRQ